MFLISTSALNIIYLRMSTTKEKILKCALELFNTHGTPNISQRNISDALKISPGNLTYHFKKKEDIETGLYFELVSIIDQNIRELNPTHPSLKSMAIFLDQLLKAFYAYRFIFLDFVHIMRNNQKIATFHMELAKQRKQQFKNIISQLIESNIFRMEEIKDEYLHLYDRIAILSDFWMIEAEVTKKGVKKNHLPLYRKVILHSIYPYLTKVGKIEFQQLSL